MLNICRTENYFLVYTFEDKQNEDVNNLKFAAFFTYIQFGDQGVQRRRIRRRGGREGGQ